MVTDKAIREPGITAGGTDTLVIIKSGFGALAGILTEDVVCIGDEAVEIGI